VTVKKKLPVIEFVSFVIPTGIRQYDEVLFNITVKNNATVNASGVTIKILKDGWTYCTTEPFNLTAGQTKSVQALVTIMDPGDVSQNFSASAGVGALSFSKTATVYVGHRIYAAIGVKAFTMSPTKKENQPKDSTQSFTAKLTLKNIGEKAGSVQVLIVEGKKVLANTTANVDGSASKDVSYTVKLSGAGKHKLTVVLSLPSPDPGNMTMNATCELQYQPGFEVVVVVASVLVAAALFRRRKD
jgi:PGF-CTERM protein